MKGMGAAMQPQPFGKYFLLEKIATGGMAEIYKAKYRAEGGFEKTLVIKRILPHLANDEEFVSMFRDEARLTVRLSHANVVQVFDFGRINTDYFLAMEYVQGQNLRAVMKRCHELGATVPLAFALFTTIEIAKGLSYAHTRRDEQDREMGIVHRDITPSNILLSYEGEVKIADFGIAKAASRSSGTQAGMIKGKASYLAPEQVLGKPIDGRADVFALGAVLWEMLVGRKLFTGETDFEIMNRITATPISAPSEANATVPPEVDRVVMGALDRDPERRYPNAGAFQRDLALLHQQFGGNATSSEIAAFLRRLFKKEMEAEKEASRSMRMPVIDDSRVSQAASDGATLLRNERTNSSRRINAGEEITGLAEELEPLPAEKTRSRSPFFLLGALVMVVFAVGLLAAGRYPDLVERAKTLVSGFGPVATATPAATSTAVAIATPKQTPPGTPATPEPTPATTASTGASKATPVRTAAAATPAKTATLKATPTKVALATPAPTAHAPAEMGVVKLNSTPWGEIYVDGRPIGRQTPAFDIKVPAGKRKIRIVNPVQKLEISFEVDVDPAKPVVKNVKLEPAK